MDEVSELKKKNKRYNEKEVLESCLKYFNGDELAATTWMNKYAIRSENGDFLERTPNDMHHRMAKSFSEIEEIYISKPISKSQKKELSKYGRSRLPLTEEKIYGYFKNFKYIIPQGSVMAALGNDNIIASLSNCVVLPSVYDSYGGICYTDQQLAQLFKRRCGVGIDISELRPKDSIVSNAAGTTTGAVSFMERFSNTTREVAQNGRRGALMITMDIAHPDVEDFIVSKQDLTKVTGANISVRLSDEFMQAVKENAEFIQRWPIDSEKPTYSKKIKALDLWKVIVKCAHSTAEPGLIFWDKQHNYSTSSVYPDYKNVSTNPCSEIAMQGGDSCRLIALNLYSFVENPFTSMAHFNFEKFHEVTYEAQRLMDNLVDLELKAIENILVKIKEDKEPDFIKSIELETWEKLYETGKKGRRTGLGFTALGDAMAALGFAFDSKEALDVINIIMKAKCKSEFDCTIDLAIERGTFEGFDPKIEATSDFVKMLKDEFPEMYNRMMKFGRRNISISTVAPTGSLSILAQTSSGIEPVFLLSYLRRRKLTDKLNSGKAKFIDALGDAWEEFTVYHPKLKEWMSISGKEDVDESPYAGSTAPEIDWFKRIEIQSVIQKYVTHSISSTINLPSDVSEEKVGEIYLKAWELGLKGVTVYRDGSRSGVLIDNSKKKDDVNMPYEIQEKQAPPRPKTLKASVVRFQNDHDKWIAVIGVLNGKPYEIFTGRAEDSFFLPNWVEQGWVIKNKDHKGQNRYDFRYVDKDGYRVTIEGLSRSFNQEFWNYAKLISGVLRHGMPLPYVVDLVVDLNLYNDSINTWKNGVARALKMFIPNGTQAVDKKCPDCGDPEGLIYEEGCLKCKSCGLSKCG